MTWPMADVPGCGPSFILKGRADDHVPRPSRTDEARRVQREIRATARAEGRCVVCTTEPAKDECSSCVTCLGARSERAERQDARRKRWRESRQRTRESARAGARGDR